MVELFPNVPSRIKSLTSFWLNLLESHYDAVEAAVEYATYVNSLEEEEYKDYANFAFQCWIINKKGE